MSATYLRRATQADLPAITAIISGAKAYLKEQHINQWQDGYPDPATLKQDIKDGITFVLIYNNTIAGTAALHQGIDVNYLKIEDGQWISGTDDHYSAIHRIAVASNFRGHHLSETLMTGLITISGLLGFKDIRIDTHPENKGMQHVITSSGFDYRGIVHMQRDNAVRYAYQLLIK
ncbi:MAG TPA: N-acetyltransferase [Lactobacillus sp.]|uniref:GNAT family acetyltransferase n=1 Tax=Secundilactobacillus silagincola TaxID=1714681 RepID=A0A1Z5J177_9LACO|nr:GNAT family N-acetyltransferase [Secundilactobacillus silagincola]GAX07636.1 GNAT family acetyltransferase [Secundilactobacillus silagincola]HBF73850.1 N-acetyltransferase [Lactobacillus sp.]